MLILAGVVLLSCFSLINAQVAPPIAEKFVNNQLNSGVRSRGPPSAAPPNLATLLSLNSQPDNKVLARPIQDITRNEDVAPTNNTTETSAAPSSSTTPATTASTEQTPIVPFGPSTTKAPSTAIEPVTVTTHKPSTSATTTTTKKAPTTTETTTKSSTTTTASTTTKRVPTTTEAESSNSEESSEEVTVTSTSTLATTVKSVPKTTVAPTTTKTAETTTVPEVIAKEAESPFAEPDMEGEGTQEFKTNKIEDEKMKHTVMALSSKFEKAAAKATEKSDEQENISGSSEVFGKLTEVQELSLLKKVFNPAIGANAFGVKTLKSEDEASKIHNIDGSNPSLPPFAFSEDAETEGKIEDISKDNFEQLISDITKTMMENIPTVVSASNITVDEKVHSTTEKVTVKEKAETEKQISVIVEAKPQSAKVETPKEVLHPEKKEIIKEVPIHPSTTETPSVPESKPIGRVGIVPFNVNGEVLPRKETINVKKAELQQKKKTIFSNTPDAFNVGKNFVPVHLFFNKTNEQTSIIHRKKHTKRRRVTPIPKRLDTVHLVDGAFDSHGRSTATAAPPTSATVQPTQPFGIQTESVPIVELVTPAIRTTQNTKHGKKRRTKGGRARGLSKSTELIDHFESSSIAPVRTDDFLIARPNQLPVAPPSDRELLQKRFEELENKEMTSIKKEDKKIKTPREMTLPDLVTMPDLRVLNTFATLKGPARINGQSNRIVERRSSEQDIDWKKTYGYKGTRKVIRVRKLKKKNIDGDIKQDKAVIGQKVDSKQVVHGKYYGKWGKAKIRPRFIKKKTTTTASPHQQPQAQLQSGSFNPFQRQPAPQFQNQNQFQAPSQGIFQAPLPTFAPTINFGSSAGNFAPTQFLNRPLFNPAPIFNPAPQTNSAPVRPPVLVFNTPPQQQFQQQRPLNNAPGTLNTPVQGLSTVSRDTVPNIQNKQIPQYLAADGRWYPYIGNQPALPQQVQPVVYAPLERSTMRPLVATEVAQMVNRSVAPGSPTVKRSQSPTISSDSQKARQHGLGRKRRGHKKLKKRSQHARARSGGKTVKIHKVPRTHMGEVDKLKESSTPFSSNSHDDRPILVDRDLARKTIDRDVRRR